MAAQEAVGEAREGCQGRPNAGRRWQREDALCANSARSSVPFGGREVPVCLIHARTHARWELPDGERQTCLISWRSLRFRSPAALTTSTMASALNRSQRVADREKLVFVSDRAVHAVVDARALREEASQACMRSRVRVIDVGREPLQSTREGGRDHDISSRSGYRRGQAAKVPIVAVEIEVRAATRVPGDHLLVERDAQARTPWQRE